MANSIEISTITTPERDTSLLDACKNTVENLNTVQSLIESGANVNAVTPSGRTALMLASYRGHSDIVAILIQNGADVDIKDNLKGMTALMFAIDSINSTSNQYKVLTIINLLIQNNANINAQTKEGKTALMMVCQKCNPDDDRDDFIFRICDTFITNISINLSITDEYNKTAMDYANENCNQNIKDLFQSDGAGDFVAAAAAAGGGKRKLRKSRRSRMSRKTRKSRKSRKTRKYRRK